MPSGWYTRSSVYLFPIYHAYDTCDFTDIYHIVS